MAGMINRIIDKIVEWSREKRAERMKIAVLMGDIALFWIIIPACLGIISITLDKWLNLPKLVSKPFNFISAIVFFVVGVSFGVRSILALYKVGKGTTSPDTPTQELVVVGPYAYIRNPNVLGLIVFYTGLGFFLNSASFIFLILPAFFGINIAYLKLIEEKELEKRFGKEYRQYKKETPMFIPRFRRKMS